MESAGGLARELAAVAADTDFSGVAVAHDGDRRVVEVVAGSEDRANGRPIEIGTRFATASATKGLTALTVAGLAERGELALDTPVRDLVGDDLPRVEPAVTIEDLLGHTSGVGDYLDEEELDDIDDYLMDTPVHLLTEPDAYLPMVAAPAQVSPPGSRFAYNNGGYVMLSIAVERAVRRSFYDVVDECVLGPAGMRDSGFFRSDRLPPGTALGYLADGRSNIFHLPVRGAGDGGAYATVADVDALWDALFAGRLVSPPMLERLTAPRRDAPAEGLRYGLGFWIAADRPTVMLEGMDAGVSFRSALDPSSTCGYTVISNTSAGAWPLVKVLDNWIGT
ncbi:MAG: serine hydrolase domain-containing protein [Ilumatobacteraceae bacterium]